MQVQVNLNCFVNRKYNGTWFAMSVIIVQAYILTEVDNFIFTDFAFCCYNKILHSVRDLHTRFG